MVRQAHHQRIPRGCAIGMVAGSVSRDAQSGGHFPPVLKGRVSNLPIKRRTARIVVSPHHREPTVLAQWFPAFAGMTNGDGDSG